LAPYGDARLCFPLYSYFEILPRSVKFHVEFVKLHG